jgi:hypothetical protein
VGSRAFSEYELHEPEMTLRYEVICERLELLPARAPEPGAPVARGVDDPGRTLATAVPVIDDELERDADG